MAALQQILIIALLALTPMTEAARTHEVSLAKIDVLKSDVEVNKNSESAGLLENVRKSAKIWWQPMDSNMISNDWTQQFQVDKNFNRRDGNEYKVELKQYEKVTSNVVTDKSEIDVNVKIPMRIKPQDYTIYGYMSVTIGNNEFNMYRVHPLGVNVLGYYTWRVAPKGADDNIMFTIQKSHDDFFGGSWSSWNIYLGRKRDDAVVYYGVGDADDDADGFKFYRSKKDYQDNKQRWVAKVDHETFSGKANDEDAAWSKKDGYEVKVRDGEDAALILLAVACLDIVK